MHKCHHIGCTYDQNMRQLGADRERGLVLASTRMPKDVNEDAHRDFDGFDVKEELARLRRAMAEPLDGKNDASVLKFVYTATANIDEYLLRGGPLPLAWSHRSQGDSISDALERTAAEHEVEVATAEPPKNSSITSDTVLELMDQKLQSPEGTQKVLEYALSFLQDRVRNTKAFRINEKPYIEIPYVTALGLVKLLGKLADK